MVLVNETGIRRVFSMRDAIEADCEAYRMFSSDEITVPLRTQIEAAGAGGVFCFMPAYSERLGIASVKTVNIFPGNVKFGITTLPSMVMTFDGETGVPSALLDGACGEVYNLSDEDEGTTLAGYAEQIARLAGRKVVYQIEAEESASKATHALMNTEKLKNLGWKPLYSVSEGLERTYRIYMGRGERR